jgi:formylglycine-generating enzyme required for sulfatase activity
MHGNVNEFCQDVYHENYNEAPTDGSAWEIEGDSDSNRIVSRGGSWCSYPWACRSANRYLDFPVEAVSDFIGFRLVSFPPRTLE